MRCSWATVHLKTSILGCRRFRHLRDGIWHLLFIFVFTLQVQGTAAHAAGNTCSEIFFSDSIKDPSEHFQKSNAKVAAQIYRYFGIHVESSPPVGSRPADLTKLNTSQIRQLRFVTAFLKDWTIDADPSVLWKTSKGELVFTKLSHSLGYFPAQMTSSGKFKRLYETSDFNSSTNIFVLAEFRDFRLPENHAWRTISQSDVAEFVQRMRAISNDDLQLAVDHGGYENALDSERVFRTLVTRRDALISKLIELYPKLDAHSDANQIAEQLMLDKLPTPAGRVERLGYFVGHNQGGFVDQLRQPIIERVLRASALPTSAEKFRLLTDEQVYAQWGGHSELNLKTSDDFKYLGKVTGLRRGDHVHLTRTIYLNKRQLAELIKTRLYVSHFLFVFNYDYSILQDIYRRIGGQTIQELLDHNIGVGGTAIPTTYAVDGWTKTRYDKPLIYDQETGHFSLQVHFSVPVEAIVTVDSRQLPSHVVKDPSGFGFAGKAADKESEISFFDWIPPEFIVTDFRALQNQLVKGTYPQQKINKQTGQYD